MTNLAKFLKSEQRQTADNSEKTTTDAMTLSLELLPCDSLHRDTNAVLICGHLTQQMLCVIKNH